MFAHGRDGTEVTGTVRRMIVNAVSKAVEEKERVVVRFAGDSGDGMQLAGNRFAAATALIGNDLVTLPDFPAEIRAPAGTWPASRPSRSTSPRATS